MRPQVIRSTLPCRSRARFPLTRCATALVILGASLMLVSTAVADRGVRYTADGQQFEKLAGNWIRVPKAQRFDGQGRGYQKVAGHWQRVPVAQRFDGQGRGYQKVAGHWQRVPIAQRHDNQGRGLMKVGGHWQRTATYGRRAARRSNHR